MQTFTDLGVSARTGAALAALGLQRPAPVQAQAIAILPEGRDLVIQAPIGSGKTLAFLLPLLERLEPGRQAPQALVVAPTRELAIQIGSVLRGVGGRTRAAVLYGGVGYGRQSAELNAHPDVVVGTPGRILDMVGRRLLNLSAIDFLVLDEADEMPDAGFARDVERIIGMTGSRPTRSLRPPCRPGVETMITKHLHEPMRAYVEATPHLRSSMACCTSRRPSASTPSTGCSRATTAR